MRGKRATWGGRQEARSTLFMAALVVTHFSSVIRAVYQRLIAAGEPKELTLTAVVRTLVVFLKAILRTGTPGRPWRARHEPAARQSLVLGYRYLVSRPFVRGCRCAAWRRAVHGAPFLAQARYPAWASGDVAPFTI